MKNLFKLLLLIMSISLLTISCSDDKDIDDEEEIISSGSSDSLSGIWAWNRDMFGDLEDDYFKDMGISAVGFSFNDNKTGTLITNGAFIKMTQRAFKYKYDKKKGKLSIVFSDGKDPNSISFDIMLAGALNSMMELKCTSNNFPDLTLFGSDIK